jgi:hypothetical protein
MLPCNPAIGNALTSLQLIATLFQILKKCLSSLRACAEKNTLPAIYSLGLAGAYAGHPGCSVTASPSAHSFIQTGIQGSLCFIGLPACTPLRHLQLSYNQGGPYGFLPFFFPGYKGCGRNTCRLCCTLL